MEESQGKNNREKNSGAWCVWVGFICCTANKLHSIKTSKCCTWTFMCEVQPMCSIWLSLETKQGIWLGTTRIAIFFFVLALDANRCITVLPSKQVRPVQATCPSVVWHKYTLHSHTHMEVKGFNPSYAHVFVPWKKLEKENLKKTVCKHLNLNYSRTERLI